MLGFRECLIRDANQLGNRFTVIHVAGFETDVEQFALIIDHQVQLEAEKPT